MQQQNRYVDQDRILGDIRQTVGELKAGLQSVASTVLRIENRLDETDDKIAALAHDQAQQHGSSLTRHRISSAIWGLLTGAVGAASTIAYTFLHGGPMPPVH